MGFWAIAGNIIWLFLGPGFASFLFWGLAGVLLAITIVGLPFSFAAFRIAAFSIFPFGQRLVDAADVGDRRIAGTTLANILWFVLAGFWLGLFHLIGGIFYCLTIIGIPFGLAHLRLAQVSLAPLGKRVIPARHISRT